MTDRTQEREMFNAWYAAQPMPDLLARMDPQQAAYNAWCAARRSIPQGDDPAKAAAQGDELPPLPTSQPYVKVWFSTEEKGESLQLASQAYYTDHQMREYGASCRAGGKADARDAALEHMKSARDAVRRVAADLGVLHEDKPPEMAATIALTALMVSGDLEMAMNSIDAAIAAHPADAAERKEEAHGKGD